MGLNETLFGKPPQTSVAFAPGYKPPGYGMASALGRYLQGLIGQPGPEYQGQLDPGMSPTMSMLGRMLQGYSTSPAPYMMGQAAGTLGRFMNPTFGNPALQLKTPTLDYFSPGSGPGGRPGVLPERSSPAPYGPSLPSLTQLLGGGPGPSSGAIPELPGGPLSFLTGGPLQGGGSWAAPPSGGSGPSPLGGGGGWASLLPPGPTSKPAPLPLPPLSALALNAQPRGKRPLAPRPGTWMPPAGQGRG